MKWIAIIIHRKWTLVLLCFLSLLMFMPISMLNAQSEVVVGTGTPGSCDEAEFDTKLAAASGGSTIRFNCGDKPHTIFINTTKIIDNGRTLSMDGNDNITISAEANVGVFQVQPGSRFTLKNITITNGDAGSNYGGGIDNNGTELILENVRILNNTATYGGGVANRGSGKLILTDCVIDNNTATQYGGGIHSSGGAIQIKNSVISNNTADQYGGGLHSRQSIVQIQNSSIFDNVATQGHGGGIYFVGGSTLTINKSAITQNSVGDLGGGIFSNGDGNSASITMVNTTIANNQAKQAGGIYNQDTATTMTNVTIAHNSVTDNFSSIENRGSSSSISLYNTIIANDPKSSIGNCASRDGATITNSGGNIQFPGDSCGSENFTVADPLLAPLASNGGDTMTMGLGANSPAIDGAINTRCPETDQRGFARPVDGDGNGTATCDIGAYELQADETPPSADNVVGDGTPESCTEEALLAAVLRSGSITFNCGENPITITVSDDLKINYDTVIDGGGTQQRGLVTLGANNATQGGLVTLSGSNSTRVFWVAESVGLTLKNLTVKDGREPGPNGEGGGIFGNDKNLIVVQNAIFTNNDGTGGDQLNGGGAIFSGSYSTLNISDSLFEKNKGINGGAINNLLSELTIENTTFTQNESTRAGELSDGHGGGAIYIDGAVGLKDDPNAGGVVRIRSSTFYTNTTAGQGGAIFSWVYNPDRVSIETSTFSGNVALTNSSGNQALGGALYHGGGVLNVSYSTFMHNLAQRQGGATWTDGDYLSTFTNNTFAYNRAVENLVTGSGGLGGAMAGGGNTRCVNCTIAENHAGEKGGAIYFNKADSNGKEFKLLNTLIINNTAFNNGNDTNIYQQCADDVLTDEGGNIQYPGKNASSQDDINCTETVQVINPLLEPLANNGGSTRTMALQGTSKAIDAGTSNGCPSLDQRSKQRPLDGDGDGVKQCDSGAYEYDGPPMEPTYVFVYLPMVTN